MDKVSKFRPYEVVRFRGTPAIVTSINDRGQLTISSYAGDFLTGPDNPQVERFGRIIPADSVSAIGRFNPNGPAGYQAQVPGGKVWRTRAAALSEVAAYWIAQEVAR